jgi:hypothetical protein
VIHRCHLLFFLSSFLPSFFPSSPFSLPCPFFLFLSTLPLSFLSCFYALFFAFLYPFLLPGY